MNIVEYLASIGFPPTIPNGPGVMRGPCFACGTGVDRLAVWENGGYYCRICGAKGGFAKLLELTRGLSPAEAKEQVRAYRAEHGAAPPREGVSRANEVVNRSTWRGGMMRLIEIAQEDLKDSMRGRDYLYEERGLTDASIRRYRLGMVREDTRLKRSQLGLTTSYKAADGHEIWRVSVPEGILIPHLVQGEGVVAATVRCWDGNNGRYRSLPGSSLEARHIAGTDPGFDGVVAVVESALCGIKLNQDTGVSVVALGGVNAPLGPCALGALLAAEKIVLVMDDDDAGIKAAASYEMGFPNAVSCPVPGGKDVTEAWLADLDLRKFMQAAVGYADRVLASRRTRGIGLDSVPEARAHPRSVEQPSSSSASSGTGTVAQGSRIAVSVPSAPYSRAGLGDYRHIMDAAEARKAVRSLMKTSDLVAVDIETAKRPKYRDHPKAGLDPSLSRIRLVQLCGRAGEPLIIDAVACGRHLKEILAPVFAKKTVVHNAVFEMKHLAHVGVETGVMDCTMLMFNALTNLTHRDPAPGGGSGGALSLKNVLLTRLDVDLKKEEQLSDWGAAELSEEQLRYAAGDVRHLTRLHDRLLNRLRIESLEGVYRRMRDAQPAVVAMELGGMRFDTKRHAEMMAEWRDRRDSLTREVQEDMGAEINPGSPQQLGDFLKEVLPEDRLRAWPQTPKGLLETKEAVLEANKDLPGVAPLLDLRKASKLLSTYGKKMAELVNPVTGRLSASFHLAGAVTGRMASSKPSFQNLPREAIREMFLADPGHVILTADYSQIELRVAAQLANDKTLLEAYRKGVDIHRFTASLLFSCPEGEVSKEQRQMAKAVAFGTLYGQGDKGLQEYARGYGVEITLEQAKALQQKLFAAYTGLRRWREDTRSRACRNAPVMTLGGRVRRFGDKEAGVYTKSLNTPIQGTAAEILLHALARVTEALKPLDARLVSTVHDEIVLTCHEKDADKAEAMLKDCMTQAYLEMFPGAPTTGLVECGRGKNWAEAK